MLGRKQELNLQFQQITDGAMLVVAFWVSHVLRYNGTYWFGLEQSIPKFAEFQWMLFVIMPFGPIMLELQGFYSHPFQKTLLKSLGQIFRAGVCLAAILAICVIFFRRDVPSRAVLLIFAALAFMVLLFRESVTALYLRNKARSGKYREHVLLAGVPGDLAQLRKSLGMEHLVELEIVGEVDIETEPISYLVACMHKHSVSRVIFAGGQSNLNRLQEAIGACELEGVEAWLVADFIKTSIARPDFDVMGPHPMLVFRTTPDVYGALMVKNVIDRIGALVALILASPLFVIVPIAIRLTSPGPVIFRQTRAGKHGKPFTMYKFRSMATDAEMRQAELQVHNQMTGPVFKVANDPRVTRIGRLLRTTSIDELPQLVNVLRGHMSLVGPRPLPIYEVEKFEKTAQRRRLSVKPGLTCLWQISGRSQLKDFDEWVRLDLKYIDNWSIWLDLKIILKTIPVVLFGTGAR